jgi:transposase
MLNLSSSIRIFVCATPTDMRKQFDGLSAIVTHALGQDVMTGDYFVFINRGKNRCKVLCWDRDGFAMWAKRLERGRFQFPCGASDVVNEIDATTLAMMLGGIDLDSVQRRKRYQVTPAVVTNASGRATPREIPNATPAP